MLDFTHKVMSKARVILLSAELATGNQVLFSEIFIEWLLCAKQYAKHCGDIQR